MENTHSLPAQRAPTKESSPVEGIWSIKHEENTHDTFVHVITHVPDRVDGFGMTTDKPQLM